MLSRVSDIDSVARAVKQRRVVADGPGDLNATWLQGGDRVALAEESGRHLETELCERLGVALREAGVTQLTAISNDPLVLDEMVYALDASTEDLAAFSDAFFGINGLLVPREELVLAVLFSTDDYRLIAGPRDFVVNYAGDVATARDTFVRFANEHFAEMQPLLKDAARYMDWIEVSDDLNSSS